MTNKRVSCLKFLKAALRSMKDGVVIVDAQNRFVFLNEASLRMKQGLSVQELRRQIRMGECDLRYVDGRPVPKEETPLMLALHDKTVMDMPFVVGRANGTTVYIRNTASPITDENGNVIGAISVFRDISGLKRTQEERERLLREIDAQRRLFEAVVNHAPAGIAIVNGKVLRIKWANPAGKLLVEQPYRSSDIEGLQLRDVIPHFEDTGLAEAIRQALDTGRVQTSRELEYLGFAPGPTYWRWIVVPLLPSEEQEASDVLLMAMEITEQVTARKRAEELAVRAESALQQLEAVVNSMGEGLAICDLEGNIVRVNPALLRIYGLQDAEAYPRHIDQFRSLVEFHYLDGCSVSQEDWPLTRVLRGESFSNLELQVRRLDTGRTWIASYNGSPVRNRSGEIILAIITMREITTQKEAERLRQEYLSLISHDLQQPLAVLMGTADLLHDRLSLSESLQYEVQSVETIIENAKWLSSMLDELVQSAHLESGHLVMYKENTDLLHLVSRTIRHIGSAQDQARIHLEAPDSLPLVAVDAEYAERAIMNIITNALKYSPQDTPVIIRLGWIEKEAIVSVSDRGVGILTEDLPYIFDRFYRARVGRRGDGLGLGLYIARLIVEAHGGRIWAESQVSKGSTFHLTLPLV